MDRFMLHVFVDYPDEKNEGDIIRLVRAESATPGASGEPVEPIPQQVVFDARAEIDAVHCSRAIDDYFVDLVFASRYADRYEGDLKHWVEVGASPRAGIAFDRCSRVLAWLDGRDYVTPDDVRAIAHDVMRHRLILSYEANAEGVTADEVVSEIVKQVAVP